MKKPIDKWRKILIALYSLNKDKDRKGLELVREDFLKNKDLILDFLKKDCDYY